MTIRTFIAITIPDDIKNTIGKTVKPLMATRADVRWIEIENLHITVKFLGNVEIGKIRSIEKVVTEIAIHYKPFEIIFENIGWFPNMKRPRVIWIGVRNNSILTRILLDTDEMLSKIGFEKERRQFSPHLTIGRVRSAGGYDTLKNSLIKLTKSNFGNMTTQSLSLMKSELSPAGVKYTLMGNFPLSTG